MGDVYLGDCVYMTRDSNGVVLCTDNGNGKGPQNIIYLSADTLSELYSMLHFKLNLTGSVS